MAMVSGMVGLSEQTTKFDKSDFLTIVLLLAFVWLMPNVQQWMARFRTALDAQPRESWLLRWFPVAFWSPSPVIGVAIGVLGFFALAVAFSVAPTEFLYFQF
jgi:alginate O-acetyltransferase complex protein AlgI